MSSSRTKVLLSFAAVYVVWGSTYLAVRIAGRTVPVPAIAAARTIVSLAVLLLICLLGRKELRVPRADAWRLMVVGFLFMSANNLLLTAGTQMVRTGMASLLMATTPIMVAALGWKRDRMSARGWAGTLIATAGIVALVWPRLHVADSDTHRNVMLGTVLLLGASFAFALGAVLSRRWQFQADTWVATTWQVGTGALVNSVVAFALEGNWLRGPWSLPAVSAILYIATFGAVLTLAAFTYLLRRVATTKVATYAFVNPVVAVLLGVAILHERFVPIELLGMMLVLIGVVMVVMRRGVLRRS